MWHDATAGILYFFETSTLPRIIIFSAIALVPKVVNPFHSSQFRPISCCNILYKCITKLLASRMKVVANALISPPQTAFVPGRKISDNVFLAQSLCCDYRSPKLGCF